MIFKLGMDPASRRSLWNLLLKEKKDRTILVSTHFMDEVTKSLQILLHQQFNNLFIHL